MRFVTCSIQHEVDLYVAMSHGHQIATELGFNTIDRTRIEIVILELARNLIIHANGGELSLEICSEGAQKGIRITTRDNGPGIADIELALRDGFSTGRKSLGSGLPGVKRLMDVLTIDSTIGGGTHISTIKWVPNAPGEARSRGKL